MLSRFYGIGTACAGALLAGVLLVGASAPASAQGTACREQTKTGIMLQVVRPGISITLQKGAVHPVQTQRYTYVRHDQQCDNGWHKGYGHHRGEWQRKHERRDGQCRDNQRRGDHRWNGQHKSGCRH